MKLIKTTFSVILTFCLLLSSFITVAYGSDDYEKESFFCDDFSSGDGALPGGWETSGAANGNVKIANEKLRMNTIRTGEYNVKKSFDSVSEDLMEFQFDISFDAGLTAQTQVALYDSDQTKKISEVVFYSLDVPFIACADAQTAVFNAPRTYFDFMNKTVSVSVILDNVNKKQTLTFTNAADNALILQQTISYIDVNADNLGKFVFDSYWGNSKGAALDNVSANKLTEKPGFFTEKFSYSDKSEMKKWDISEKENIDIENQSLLFKENSSTIAKRKFNAIKDGTAIFEYAFKTGEKLSENENKLGSLYNSDNLVITAILNFETLTLGNESKDIISPKSEYRVIEKIDTDNRTVDFIVDDITKNKTYVYNTYNIENEISTFTDALFEIKNGDKESLILEYISLYKYENFALNSVKTGDTIIQNGDTDVQAGGKLFIEFNNSIASDSIDKINLHNAIGAKKELDKDGKTVIFTLTDGLLYNHRYIVTISDNLESILNETLSSNEELTFTTYRKQSGMITIGDYKVTDENGNVVDSLSGHTKITVSVPVTGNFPVDEKGQKLFLLVGLRNADNKLIDFKTSNIVSKDGETVDLSVSIDNLPNESGISCDAYIWDGMPGEIYKDTFRIN